MARGCSSLRSTRNGQFGSARRGSGWLARSSRSSTFGLRASRRTAFASDRPQPRNDEVALTALRQSPVPGSGRRRRGFAHGRDVVGRPVAKSAARPGAHGRLSARRIHRHRPVVRLRIPLSMFNSHEKYPLSAETGGGHSIGSGVSPSGESENSAYTRFREGSRGARPQSIEFSTEHAGADDPRAAIVARSQLQRKQRLDAAAPCGASSRIEGSRSGGEGASSRSCSRRSRCLAFATRFGEPPR